MKKIKTANIKIGNEDFETDLYSVDKEDFVENVSRVYVIVGNNEGKVPLIFNSKRNIWGFPGGHIEAGESVSETANRECIEEIKKNIKDCEQKFLMLNHFDDKKEKHLICFARIGKESNEFVEKNESVKEVVYTPIDEIISKIGNEELWGPVIEVFKKLIQD